MDNRPLMVTIQCITYNHEPYIRQALEGFVMQKTNFRFEAIVHDDASTDGTAAIIREYAELYPDIIKPIYETENQYSKGDGSLGRIMREHTHGKYVALCEGDDYWTDPNKLQMQVDFLEANPEYGMCYCQARTYIQDEKKFRGNIATECNNFDDLLYSCGSICTLTVIYKKETISGYNEYIADHEGKWMMGDLPLWLYISSKSKIKFIDKKVAVYRVLKHSAMCRDSYERNSLFLKSKHNVRSYFASKTNHDVNAIDQQLYVDLFGASFTFKKKNETKKYYTAIKNPSKLIKIQYLISSLGLTDTYFRIRAIKNCFIR